MMSMFNQIEATRVSPLTGMLFGYCDVLVSG